MEWEKIIKGATKAEREKTIAQAAKILTAGAEK